MKSVSELAKLAGVEPYTYANKQLMFSESSIEAMLKVATAELEAKVAELEKADKIAELEKRVQQLEISRMPFGPLPKQPMSGKCLCCGEEHGALPCPKLTPNAAIAAERGKV